MSQRAVVLLSGGADSTACIQYYLDLGFEVRAIFIDYGQLAASHERKAAFDISLYYGIDLCCLETSSPTKNDIGYIPGRNLLLVSLAISQVKPGESILCIGLIGGSSYPDCTPSFVTAVQDVADVYFDGRLKIEAPLIKWSKIEVIQYLLLHSSPFHMLYSCELGQYPCCHACSSCKDMEEAYVRTTYQNSSQ